MSIENNQSRTIDGLNTLFCDTINVVESIELNGDNGAPNQLIRSDGTNSVWANISDLLASLTLSSPLSFTSGTTFNGDVARTLQISNIPNAKLEHSTISGIALGSNLATLTFSNPLTATTYNGVLGTSVSIADGAISNDKLEENQISGIALGSNLADLSGGSGITMTAYNGGTARSIALTENSISGVALGDDLANLTLTGYGLNTMSPYNGNTAQTISLKIVGGGGITADGNGLQLTSSSITIGGTTISLGGTATDIDMNSGEIEDAELVDCDLLREDNKILPPNVFVVSGAYHMPFNAGIFHPNDDNSYYNYSIADSGAKVDGRGKIMTTSLEICGFVDIPRGWSATGSMVDVRDSGGNVLTSSIPTYQIKKVFTYRIEGGTPAKIPNSDELYYGSGVSVGAEQTFYGDVSVAAAVAETLLIVVQMTSSSHYIGGGYLIITPPS